jgi:hypothetical protein
LLAQKGDSLALLSKPSVNDPDEVARNIGRVRAWRTSGTGGLPEA